MAELFNVSTRAPEQVPDNLVDQALADGTHSYPAGTQVSLKAPDGSYAQIPAENIHYALGQGYKVFTPTQHAIDTAVEQNKGLGGTAKVLGSQMLDQLGLGIPELIYKKSGDPLAVAQYEAIKKDHEAANILGNTLGFGGSLFTGGPLFKGAAAVEKVVAGQIARRLGVEAAEQVGSRTLTQAAKEIAANVTAKTAGGAAEGLVLFAPHAATEAALGDPEQAGETLLAGLGTGAFFGLGGQVAKGLLGLGKAGLERASKLVGEAPLTAQKAAQVGAETLTGVKGEMIPKYLENPERINAAPTIEETKDLIDQHISKFQQELDSAKLGADQAKLQRDEAYRFKLQDLKAQTAPEPLRNQIMTDLEAQKGILGDMSEQADDLIGRSGATFNKQDLVDFVDKIGKSVGAGKTGALIGDEAVNAVGKLKNMKDRIEGSLPDVIDGQTLRDVMRQVRKDINWNVAAGAVSDTENRLKTKFTEGISSVLKDQVPGYQDLMNDMAQRSSTLAEASKLFGTPQRADSTLNNILNPKNKFQREILEKFQQHSGNDYFGQLEQLKNAKDTLAQSTVQDLHHQVVPDFAERADFAQKSLQEAQQKYADLIRRLNPNRTQSVVTRQGFKNASIEDRRALDILGGLTGENFSQKIEDRHILDSFNKPSSQGSRKSAPGAIMGSAIGGLLGGPAGAAAGATIGSAAGIGMDIYGGKLLKKFLDNRPDVSGLLFVEQQMKKAADKLDEIPGVLDRLTSKTFANTKGAAIDITGQVMQKERGDNGRRLSKHEQLDHMRNEMSAMQANPAAFQARLASYSSPISGGGAPNIGGQFNLKMSNAFTYLFGQLPKPPAVNSPFAPRVVFRPSDQEVTGFAQKLQVVNDPLSVIDMMKYGTLTKNHMDALKAVYPKIHGLIQQKVMQHVMDGKAKPMPYQNRLKLSMLMGAPMDSSTAPQNLQVFQHMYQIPDETVDKSNQRSVDLSSNSLTETQRIESKG